jgi:uncharacterized protein (DUF58 family)
MINIYKQLFFSTRFFLAASLIVVFFAASFIVHWLFPIGQVALILLGVFTLTDGILLISKKKVIFIERSVPNLLSLGDENRITYFIKNSLNLNIKIHILDELPYQLQIRDFKIEAELKNNEEKKFEYTIRPTSRGEYIFGDICVLVTSPLGCISQKQQIPSHVSVHVYPSIIQMKKYELKSQLSNSISEGIRQHRRIGHSYEFDQIKEYVIGDDSRSINWKASGRKSALMVNQYEDERAQQVYSIIDKGRTMRMPFHNLTLLDYAINSSLVISNVVLQKHDKAGLITFSDKIGTIVSAEKNSQQLKKILEALYNEQEQFPEAEYELLYHLVRNIIKNRSLIFLYTNFESIQAFARVLPILRQINKLHMLVVMFFDNEEIVNLSKRTVTDLREIYVQIMARKYLEEKNRIVTELSNHGIHCIKSMPKDLSMHTINKYLELKSRGMI